VVLRVEKRWRISGRRDWRGERPPPRPGSSGRQDTGRLAAAGKLDPRVRL